MTRHIIIDPGGAEHPLDGSDGVTLLRDVSGREAPPYELDSDPAVGRQGGVLRRVRVAERDVTLPVLIESGTGTFRDRVRELMTATNPRRGDSRLRVEYDDGDTFDLVGRVAEVVATGSDRYPGHQRATLVWRAFDPYWRGSEVVRGYTVDAPDFFTVPDGFPLQLASATISAVVSEDNAGDADAWPVWTIRGPGVPRLENVTTDRVLEFDDLTLAVGDELTVDTTPGVKTVEVNGDNVYDQLTLESSLFGLAPGVNMLNVDLEDGTEQSLVRLRYRPRTLAP